MPKHKDISLFDSDLQAEKNSQKTSTEQKKSPKNNSQSIDDPVANLQQENKSKHSKQANMKVQNSIEIQTVNAEFCLGDRVQHKLYDVRGIIIDVDPEFKNTEEWYLSIPEKLRPRKNQPFYHLLAEGSERYYSAYVSQQNLLIDESHELSQHPDLSDYFEIDMNGKLKLNTKRSN